MGGLRSWDEMGEGGFVDVKEGLEISKLVREAHNITLGEALLKVHNWGAQGGEASAQ